MSATRGQMRKWLLREFIFLFVCDAHDAVFTGDFNDGKEDADVGFFVTANDERIDVGVLNGVAQFVSEFRFTRFFAFQEDDVFGGDDEGEMGGVWITRSGVKGAGGEVDLAVRFYELTTHHEENEELKDDVDERGHIDPGIYASFTSDEHDLSCQRRNARGGER